MQAKVKQKKTGASSGARGVTPSEAKGQKIFESWETIALISIAIEITKKVSQAKHNLDLTR